jgi:hypothetical protein
MAGGADRGEEDDILDLSVATIVPVRRRQLGKVVVGALAACAVIIIAAGIARIGHASSEPSASAATGEVSAANGAAGMPTTPNATSTVTSSPPAAAATASDPASSGTVRLSRPTLWGHVWLDGKKLSATSVVVSCGTHQVKVGHGRKHSIDVPCGGEISISH